MASQATGPGVLYVNSKITSSKLSSEIFTKWYEDVHIPDIFETSGIKSAYRYYTTSREPEAVERPYLALYLLRDVSFLQTAEFKSIPVHSDMVPSENKCIFDLADFDTRYYTNIAKHESGAAGQGPKSFIVSHQFDLPSENGLSGDKDVLGWYLKKHESNASRVRLYHLYFGRQNRMSQEEKKLAEPPQYLALVEYDREEDLRSFLESDKSQTGTTPAFSLLKAFGNTEHNF
ncbi:hypothetical protein LTR10_018682 [Elasticomyces elasticus]|uniref:EthD domain-containing protein n=1 Tax=Exophiala sideris TaxID=1016849 RepID=A0ABR0JT15_9EURO|nr:hypothetical protein LTR10_018682 [Elasticomyces elasticus]KAK5040429.1 hypothetical protein LTS07_000927 [Exophiala sideris]KAK5043145.1 hypothetical protein LTR13_000916 [Exophiala sideris]KAK5068807.1 hypothetical protein LTR69_000928 [Exophiala sideris]KAK5186404.1 hypothetical protein LTR44_001460 [Eurotiomycetes sp. CCFEE 6388]